MSSAAEPPGRDTAPIHVPAPATQRAEEAAETPADTLRVTPGFAPAPPAAPGRGRLPNVPGFTLLQELGRGGMGVVYLARQEQLHRLVALKMILRAEFADAADLERFQAEAKTVAALRHPHIVQVHEAGLFGDQPYFALEYLEGGSLDRILRRQPLPPAEAAALVEKLARAVDYAHRQGVIHRDLKPANVLLGEPSASAGGLNPKVADFGLAKHLGEGRTQTGKVVGTPSYMAPEQAAGRTREVGPATDVYALGAILYECLTGRPPFLGATPHRVIDLVLNREPLAVRAHQPGTPKDLETICHRCLRKEPGQRYASATALADDLKNFLEGKPIAARPVGRAERTVKWCKRYPAAAALIAVSVTAALAATGLAWWAVGERNRAEEAEAKERKSAKTEQAARERADQRTRHLERSIQFIASVFDSVDARRARANEEPVEQLLARRLVDAASQLRAELVGEELSAAMLQDRLGGAVTNLGFAREAIPVLEQAVACRKERLGPDHRETLRSCGKLATALLAAGKTQEALALQQETLERSARALGPDDPDTLTDMAHLALCFDKLGRFDKSIELDEHVVRRRMSLLGTEHRDTLVALNNLATSQLAAGKPHEARRSLEALLPRQRAALGADDPDTLLTLANLAVCLRQTGRLDLALPLYEEAYRRRLAASGASHPETLTALNNLANGYRSAGRLELALPLYEEALALLKAKLGPHHARTLTTMGNLASCYRAAGKLDLAVPLLEETLRRKKDVFGPDHLETLMSMSNLAVGYASAGSLAQAARLHEEALQLKRAKLGPEHPETLTSLSSLAQTLAQLGQDEKALSLLRQAAAGVEKGGFRHPFAGPILGELSTALEDARAWAEAESWRRKWAEHLNARGGPGTLEQAAALTSLALNLLHQGKPEEAEPLLRGSLALREKLEPEAWSTANAQALLGGALADLGKNVEGEQLQLSGCRGLLARRGKIPPSQRFWLEANFERLVKLLERVGKPEEAAKWRGELAALQPKASPKAPPAPPAR